MQENVMILAITFSGNLRKYSRKQGSRRCARQLSMWTAILPEDDALEAKGNPTSCQDADSHPDLKDDAENVAKLTPKKGFINSEGCSFGQRLSPNNQAGSKDKRNMLKKYTFTETDLHGESVRQHFEI